MTTDASRAGQRIERRTITSGCAAEAPFTWTELCELVAAGRFDVLGRESSLQLKYASWQTEVRRTWRSIADLCKTTYLGFAETIDPVTGLRCASDFDGLSTMPQLFPNAWPYWLEPGIQHSVLWSRRELDSTDASITAMLDAHAAANSWHPQEWLVFRNPAARQSIPEVFHLQVFHRDRRC